MITSDPVRWVFVKNNQSMKKIKQYLLNKNCKTLSFEAHFSSSFEIFQLFRAWVLMILLKKPDLEGLASLGFKAYSKMLPLECRCLCRRCSLWRVPCRRHKGFRRWWCWSRRCWWLPPLSLCLAWRRWRSGTGTRRAGPRKPAEPSDQCNGCSKARTPAQPVMGEKNQLRISDQTYKQWKAKEFIFRIDWTDRSSRVLKYL